MRLLSIIGFLALLIFASATYVNEVSSEPSFSLEEVVFLLDAESANTLIFSSKALAHLKNNEGAKAEQILRNLVEINIEVISNRAYSPGSVSVSELGHVDDHAAMLIAALKKTKINSNGDIVKGIDELIRRIEGQARDTGQ